MSKLWLLLGDLISELLTEEDDMAGDGLAFGFRIEIDMRIVGLDAVHPASGITHVELIPDQLNERADFGLGALVGAADARTSEERGGASPTLRSFNFLPCYNYGSGCAESHKVILLHRGSPLQSDTLTILLLDLVFYGAIRYRFKGKACF